MHFDFNQLFLIDSVEKGATQCFFDELILLLPSQAFFLPGGILYLPKLKFYLLCLARITRFYASTKYYVIKKGCFYFPACRKINFTFFPKEINFTFFPAWALFHKRASTSYVTLKIAQNSQNTSTQIYHLVRPSISGYEVV